MDLEKRKGQMHSLAFGQAMAKAAEDYKKVGWESDRFASFGSWTFFTTCCFAMM